MFFGSKPCAYGVDGTKNTIQLSDDNTKELGMTVIGIPVPF